MADPVTPTPLRAAFEARDHDAVVAAHVSEAARAEPLPCGSPEHPSAP
ncbi:MAG TPA: hypothetical protein VIZ61_15325 [Solirubrobacterales bacterium]